MNSLFDEAVSRLENSEDPQVKSDTKIVIEVLNETRTMRDFFSNNSSELFMAGFGYASDLGKLRKRYAELEDFIKEFAEEDCQYGDNCPDNAGTRHGTCTVCRSRQVLERVKETDPGA
jgi:hypothetical protein